MICDDCKIDRLVTDFLNKSNICYKCIYRKKTEKILKKRTPKPLFCRICGSEVIQQENLKKRQRSVFCSCECALAGHKEQINNHWTRLARSIDY